MPLRLHLCIGQHLGFRGLGFPVNPYNRQPPTPKVLKSTLALAPTRVPQFWEGGGLKVGPNPPPTPSCPGLLALRV